MIRAVHTGDSTSALYMHDGDSMRMLLLLLAACGGSGSHAKPTTPTEKAKPDAYWDWHQSEPKSPAVPVRTTKFEPPQQCGQGPYRFTVDSVESKFVESVHLELCVTHEWKGSVRYVAPGYSQSETTFGDDHDHHKTCRADATVIVAAGSGASGPAAKSGKPAGRGGKATTTEKATAVELRGVTVANGVECPDGTHRVSVVNSSYSIGNVETPRAALGKGPIVFELWSQLPNDLKGVHIFVEQRGTPDGYTGDAWLAYRAAYDSWYKGHDEALAKSRAQGNQWRTVERAAVTPPPPPARPETKPPSPSANASWIPGYWQFTDGWVWSAGFWRVPPKDLEDEKTVEVAAAPPPAPKVEAAPDVAYHAQRKAVWTAGYWMWNGRGYVWIAGAWRIPEAAEMTWVAPVWQPTRRGTLRFVPGGFVRIGRRR